VIYTAFVVPDVSLGGRLYFNAARIETRCVAQLSWSCKSPDHLDRMR
jgi:hypothetical protein